MNYVDFNTNPAGFPLESDAILGNSQGFLQDVVLALGKMMQLPAAGFGVVLTGCVVTGSSMTDGWILLNVAGTYEIFFFEGGTVQPSYIISQTAVSKNNQDGSPVNRIYTRKCLFGSSGTTYQTQDLLSWGSVSQAFKALAHVAKGEGSYPLWVIISGLDAVSCGTGGIGAGVALYSGKYLAIPAYGSPVSSVSPVYLLEDGTWSTSSSGIPIAFSPYTDKHLRCFYRKSLHPVGSLLPMKTGVTELTTFFDGTGLGFGEWAGWAIANGSNSTLNLSAAIGSVSWIQRMS